MAKKKKKSRGDIGSDGAVSLSSPKGGFPAGAVVPLEDPLLDCMMVDIVASSTSPFPKALQYDPIILLTGEDAEDMGLVTGDVVFLLSKAETIESTTRARVHVVQSSSSASSSLTKSPSGSTKLQRSKLSSGYCHVYPQSLAQRLQGRDPTTGETEQPLVEDVPSTPSPSISTPSPSKSKFSFARGGGGDLIIASPSSSSTPKGLTKKNRQSNALWIVPVESTLGERLTKILCSTATSVTINAVTTTSITTQSSDMKVLKGSLGPPLIRAHLLSSHVSLGTTVAISVQGISTLCQVTDVQSVPTSPTTTLEEDMSTLSLKEIHRSAESQQLLANVQASLQCHESNPSSLNHIRLFQITRDTTITFGDSGISDTNTSQSNASFSSSSSISLLAGLDETIDKVQSLLLTPLVHPELFQSNPTLRPPKGVLLYGSSGAGKSTLASQVAQTLQKTHNVQIHELSCAKLQSQTSLVGQAEKTLVQAFEAASQRSNNAAASLIVLDDVHLICPRRQGMNIGADRLAATLLALLDGVETAHKQQKQQQQQQKEPLVMVLAVTNNPSLLDPALRRPGRLDTEVEVPLPDEPSTRSLILQFHLQKMGVQVTIENKSDEWIRLARLAKGFTGADLQLAVKEAIRLSVLRRNKMPIPQQERQQQSSTLDPPIIVETNDLESAIRSIKPSAIKSVSVEIPQVHWSSIGGMDEVKRQLREAVELPLTHAAMFQKLNIRPPKGVLLYGPPGCSKTLMARALATEGHMNFLAVKGPELLSKWLGESERALASLFRRARLASPSIIFFDEVDAIATKRGGGSSGGGERLLSQLLTELDGIQSGSSTGDQNKHRVMVICATNRPDLLDSALMRPGRIDRMIYVGVPDMASRFRILEIGLQGKSCQGDLDLAYLARDDVSGGLSGAELVSACRDAALLALEEHEGQEASLIPGRPPSIGMSHLVQAIEKTERQITPAMIDFYRHFQDLEKD